SRSRSVYTTHDRRRLTRPARVGGLSRLVLRDCPIQLALIARWRSGLFNGFQTCYRAGYSSHGCIERRATRVQSRAGPVENSFGRGAPLSHPSPPGIPANILNTHKYSQTWRVRQRRSILVDLTQRCTKRARERRKNSADLWWEKPRGSASTA